MIAEYVWPSRCRFYTNQSWSIFPSAPLQSSYSQWFLACSGLRLRRAYLSMHVLHKWIATSYSPVKAVQVHKCRLAKYWVHTGNLLLPNTWLNHFASCLKVFCAVCRAAKNRIRSANSMEAIIEWIRSMTLRTNNCAPWGAYWKLFCLKRR